MVRCGYCERRLGVDAETIVNEEDDSAICQSIEEALSGAIGKAVLAVALSSDSMAHERLGLDIKANALAKTIYEHLGLVVEEIPDAIPDPEGGMMKA